MLKVILVDDEDNVRESLRQLLLINHPEVDISASCSTLSSALKAINDHQPDIVLLDIEIGNENGFDIFKHFAQPSFRIIFVTAYQHYAVQAFRFSALDYLLKPIDPDHLTAALSKVKDSIDHKKINLKVGSLLHNLNDHTKNSKKIVLKTSESIHLVNLADVMYCEADRSYTTFYMSDKTRIVVSTTLGEYEDLFSDFGFFRIHQSYLLNLEYFRRYDKSDGGKAILKDNTSLPVATRKKDQLLSNLADF